MDKMVAIIFDSEKDVKAGDKILNKLAGEGQIAIFGEAVLEHSSDAINILKSTENGPISTVFGNLVSCIVNVVGWDKSVKTPPNSETTWGLVNDVNRTLVDVEYLNEIKQMLTPGKYAIIAEINEQWVAPLNSALKPLNPIILREYRKDILDNRLQDDLFSIKKEYQELVSELKNASSDARCEIEHRMNVLKDRMQQKIELTKKRIDDIQKESTYRIDTLHNQLEKATLTAKNNIEHHINEVVEDYQSRSKKLKKAWEMTKSALSTQKKPQERLHH